MEKKVSYMTIFLPNTKIEKFNEVDSFVISSTSLTFFQLSECVPKFSGWLSFFRAELRQPY